MTATSVVSNVSDPSWLPSLPEPSDDLDEPVAMNIELQLHQRPQTTTVQLNPS